MEDIIIRQIQGLQELKSKCLSVTGFYGDIDTALAALQICSTMGMDNTARLISVLNQNAINNENDLREVIENSKLACERKVYMKIENEMLCPNCNSKLEKQTKHCEFCGQKLNFDDVIKINPILLNDENINNDLSE